MRIIATIVLCFAATLNSFGADQNIIEIDWQSGTHLCPAKITQPTTFTVRVTNTNDLLYPDPAEYRVTVKSRPESSAPAENPFVNEIGEKGTETKAATCNGKLQSDLEKDLADIKASASQNPRLSPSKGNAVSWQESLEAAHETTGVSDIEAALTLAKGNPVCKTFVDEHRDDLAIAWVGRVAAADQGGTQNSGAPLHSQDILNVNLEPGENYEFKLQERWHNHTLKSVSWPCGESDVFTLSVGPLITTLPYRTYNQQQVPTASGTKNELVVSGSTNVNVLGAALINVHPVTFPWLRDWAALSVGPVYTLGNAPSVSKLGLFVGGSLHLYGSFFVTPGVHIGEFADFPAGFHSGSVIPSGFGSLTPVTRNTAHFAIGITFKTTSFKKSSQNPGNGSSPNVPNKVPGQQGISGNQGQPGQTGSGGQHPSNPGSTGNTNGGSGGATSVDTTSQPSPQQPASGSQTQLPNQPVRQSGSPPQTSNPQPQ